MAFLTIGYATSALIVTSLVSLLGRPLVEVLDLSSAGRSLLAAGWLALCVVFNGGAVGLEPPMLKRQTPLTYLYLYGASRGALLWGLDTGTMLSTFRVTSGTWAILGLVILGVAPWWSGAVYGLSFGLGLLVVTLRISRTGGHAGATARLRPLLTAGMAALLAAGAVQLVLAAG
ncbi:hypothetical protein [Pimelobacter sp. 30-1]|uniref:hypothetical protein n=1 Tax=Pimelobacter sp. 30-1 TaxID=2004991 RepID=UPI001C049EFA|nr:hypothetical protein [Pimelobacter sp. 30-1]MBU2697572.1 hypothetical protein [Pimelobacter sp. 30-1]